MTIAHQILIAAMASLLAFFAATAILLGDAEAAAPYASGTCADIANDLQHMRSGSCANPDNLTAQV